jgi:S1-C subfamily serine protease
VSDRHRRFVLVIGVFFAILLCLSGGTAAVLLAQRILQEEPSRRQADEGQFESSQAETLSQQGLLITSVDPASPAGHADLRRGQIILRIDGTAVDDPQALQHVLAMHETGDPFTLDILSGQQTRTVTLIVGDRGGSLGAGLLGADSATVFSDDLRGSTSTFPSPPETGVPGAGISSSLFLRALVVSIVAESPAEKAGMQAGDIITNVDEVAILTNDELIAAIGGKRAGDIVQVTIRRGANTLTEIITLIEHPDDPSRGFLGVQLQPVVPAATPDP